MKVAIHHDADGIYATALLVEGGLIDDFEPVFPNVFGDVSDEKFTIDMRPIDASYKGIVFDHHPDHPEKHSYKLIWDVVPTTVVVYKRGKRKIPLELTWKVIGGAVGDGQPETVPAEFWKHHSYLINETCLPAKRTVETRTFDLPTYQLLSSPVNAMCRLGSPTTALQIVLDANHPLDILENESLMRAKEEVNKAFSKAWENCRIVDIGKFVLCNFMSEVRLEGIFAQRLADYKRKTVIAINQATGAASIRGTFSQIVVDELRKRGVECGGHLGFAGAHLPKEKTNELPFWLSEAI